VAWPSRLRHQSY